MLIEKTLGEGSTVTIKLSTGEELIAKFVERTPTGIKVQRPCVLSMTKQGVGLMPYLLTVDPKKDLVLSDYVVVTMTTTDQEFADQYIQATTGITVAR